MSKAKEKQIEARRQQLSAMDKIIQNNPDEEARAGWNSYTNGFDFVELAKDEQRFQTCCDCFEYLISHVDWRA